MMQVNKRRWISGVLAIVGFWAVAGAAAPPAVREQESGGDFPLVSAGQAAPVWVDARDFTVARIAADLFAGDVQRVSGVKPALLTNQPPRAGQAVLIGTLGHSALIDRLVAEKKLDVSAIRGKWESHVIATVADPLPEVKSALVIAGSDRRGTAYGVFTLSEAMGVSPWYWWADVTPARRAQLFVAGGAHVQGPPSVKYRGIFINDEVYGIRPWSVLNFEKRKYMGPKTYAAIFELLLRLKANLCWPAMHVHSGYFNVYPENKQVADDYAIVMGSSHCEPMLFNNIEGGDGEWDVKRDGPWNFLTNRKRMMDVWEKRVRENGKFENSYTLGLRGVSDRPLEGAKSVADQVAILQEAIEAQRQLLRHYVSPELSSISQVFCPYQEVLPIYRAGLKLPEDVTLLWPDNNYGHIRQLSNPEEQKRSGGSGVYYHLAYWTWVWLCPVPPPLIAYEMHKAYDYGADNIWVFNVGDIKPAEKELTFALQMAWDIHRWTPRNADTFMAEWAGQTFGPGFSEAIASIMREYYRLAARGIPEFICRGWGSFTPKEAAQRLEAYRRIGDQAGQLAKRIPSPLQDAYYQLVQYPVQGSRLINEKMLLAHQSREMAAKGDASARELATQSAQAYAKIKELTKHYNSKMAKGKWLSMMCWDPTAIDTLAPDKEPVLPIGAQDYVLHVPARDFARKQDRPDAAVGVFPGLGFSDGVSLLSFTVPSIKAEQATEAAWVEYDLELPPGDAKIQVWALATQRIHQGRGHCYAVAINGEKPTVFDINTDGDTPEWWENTIRGYSVRSVAYAASKPRKVTLRIYLLDPGIVLQGIAVEGAG